MKKRFSDLRWCFSVCVRVIFHKFLLFFVYTRHQEICFRFCHPPPLFMVFIKISLWSCDGTTDRTNLEPYANCEFSIFIPHIISFSTHFYVCIIIIVIFSCSLLVFLYRVLCSLRWCWFVDLSSRYPLYFRSHSFFFRCSHFL